MVVLLLPLAAAAPSLLWGEAGEAFDPRGRLPDVSRSGYHGGDDPLPDVPVVANVRDFGAAGDGGTDDTAAFQRALDEAPAGAILVPDGTYALGGRLVIGRSGVVLRGESRDGTVLAFARPLAEILGPAEQWSWNGGLLWVAAPSGTTVLGDVTAGQLRGDTQLEVADATAIAPGDLVVLRLEDATTSLATSLHAGKDDGGTCDWQQPLVLEWPVRVAWVDGLSVHLAQPLRTDVRAEWSPRLESHPTISEVGVEHLSIRFPDVPYAGHLLEPGYNAVFFANSVVDSWVRDVRVENSDSAILTDRLSKNLTVSGLLLEGRPGHHGFNVAFTADSLFEDVHFAADFVHAFTLDHRSNGDVLRRVTADTEWIELDHHRDAPFENVVTNVDATVGWVNGGSWCAGPPSGARSTFWGLRGPFDPPPWVHIQANAVGDVDADEVLGENDAWIEPIEHLFPRDLYLAQRAWRRGEAYDEPREEEPPIDEPPRRGPCATDPRGFAGAWPLVLVALRRQRARRAATIVS